jgi:hypothetical protein
MTFGCTPNVVVVKLNRSFVKFPPSLAGRNELNIFEWPCTKKLVAMNNFTTFSHVSYLRMNVYIERSILLGVLRKVLTCRRFHLVPGIIFFL